MRLVVPRLGSRFVGALDRKTVRRPNDTRVPLYERIRASRAHACSSTRAVAELREKTRQEALCSHPASPEGFQGACSSRAPLLDPSTPCPGCPGFQPGV